MSSYSRQEDILKFWFGRVEETIIPSETRSRIWFGDDVEIDGLIRDNYLDDLNNAIEGKYDDWRSTSRGQLALIILFDQFPRHIYRDTPEAYVHDGRAVDICLSGIDSGDDHHLSLIERVFYYFPLLHSEDLALQNKSINAYQLLSDLAFAETRVIFESFFKFANHHYSLIEKFGRFPQRNLALSRGMTPPEEVYMNEISE
jgi:uncharacterized protein (DUF924 family)